MSASHHFSDLFCQILFPRTSFLLEISTRTISEKNRPGSCDLYHEHLGTRKDADRSRRTIRCLLSEASQGKDHLESGEMQVFQAPTEICWP